MPDLAPPPAAAALVAVPVSTPLRLLPLESPGVVTFRKWGIAFDQPVVSLKAARLTAEAPGHRVLGPKRNRLPAGTRLFGVLRGEAWTYCSFAQISVCFEDEDQDGRFDRVWDPFPSHGRLPLFTANFTRSTVLTEPVPYKALDGVDGPRLAYRFHLGSGRAATGEPTIDSMSLFQGEDARGKAFIVGPIRFTGPQPVDAAGRRRLEHRGAVVDVQVRDGVVSADVRRTFTPQVFNLVLDQQSANSQLLDLPELDVPR